ncbi:ArnT family glycosyltransferase [Pontibacter populi]|uniref:Glycosyltransferase family 39 protein n=1 Tax=Pontibacter populi TaxID=890055 RepID=A0ABV1RU07_9BACT
MHLQNWLQSRSTVWVLLAILLVALLYNLGGWGVLETSEARYAEISREMLVSGNVLHPRLLGILHYHKPPVTYIISAAGMSLFGVNAFGARFFLQLSFILQALLVYQVGWLLFKNRSVAFTALIVYVTTPAVLVSARNLTTDSFLATFELLAIWCWINYKLQSKPAWLFLFYSSLALAFLTKGPVGLIFPVMVVIGFKSNNTFTAKHSVRHLAGIVFFLLMSASWYIYLMVQDKQFVDYFILKHLVDRYANPETFHRSKPWWFYLLLAPALSLPWIAILFLYFRKLKHLVAVQKRLFILWLLAPLLFFSISSSKLILYILPFFSGLALLVAWLLHQLDDRQRTIAATIGFGYFILVSVGLGVVPQFTPTFSLPTIAYGLLACILLSLFLLWKNVGEKLPKLLLAALAFTLLLIPLSTHVLEADPDKTNATGHLATVLKKEGLTNHNLIVYDKLLPSLAFELQQNLVSIHDKNRSLERETQFEKDDKWRQNYLQLTNPADSAAFVKLLTQQSVFIVKGELPENRSWIIKHFTRYKRVGSWQLYY